jgi:hypothetical protein
VDDALLARRAAAHAADDEYALCERELRRVGVDTGELDDDGDGGRIRGAVDVDGRPEATPGGDQARYLAEVGEELFHLALEAVSVLARVHGTIVPMARLLKVAAAGLAFALYVWVAAVKNRDLVNERKRSRRGT